MLILQVLVVMLVVCACVASENQSSCDCPYVASVCTGLKSVN